MHLVGCFFENGGIKTYATLLHLAQDRCERKLHVGVEFIQLRRLLQLGRQLREQLLRPYTIDAAEVVDIVRHLRLKQVMRQRDGRGFFFRQTLIFFVAENGSCRSKRTIAKQIQLPVRRFGFLGGFARFFCPNSSSGCLSDNLSGHLSG